MAPQFEFHSRAIKEARAARNWYARRNVQVAQRFMAELDRAIQLVQEPQFLEAGDVAAVEEFDDAHHLAHDLGADAIARQNKDFAV